MAELEREIAAYEKLKGSLESSDTGRWVLVYGDDLVGIFPSFEVAAGEAVKRFGRGPYLIRQIGAPPFTMPASVMFRPVNG